LGLCPVAVFTKTKYMNIHSTVQYSTVQYKYTNITKHKKQKIQKTHSKYMEKHIHIHKNTRKYEKNRENTNILPGNIRCSAFSLEPKFF
jgi:hypothetical protein